MIVMDTALFSFRSVPFIYSTAVFLKHPISCAGDFLHFAYNSFLGRTVHIVLQISFIAYQARSKSSWETFRRLFGDFS